MSQCMIINTMNPVIRFLGEKIQQTGRWKNKRVIWIYEFQPDYCKWVIRNQDRFLASNHSLMDDLIIYIDMRNELK